MTAPLPLGDVNTAAGVALRVIHELVVRQVNFGDVIALTDAVQQILVDFGVEPAIVLEASRVLEVVAPLLLKVLLTSPAAPRSGPPIAAADWSHGIPKPVIVTNPSGDL